MQVLDGILNLVQLYQLTGEGQLILYIWINNMGDITDMVCFKSDLQRQAEQ